MPDQFGNPSPDDLPQVDPVVDAHNNQVWRTSDAFSNVIPFQKPDDVAKKANAADKTGLPFDDVVSPADVELAHRLSAVEKELESILGQTQYTPMLRWLRDSGNTALMSDDLPMLKLTASAMDRIKADASVLDDRPELGVVRSFGAGGQSAVRGTLSTLLAGPAWVESWFRARDAKYGFMQAFDAITDHDRANDEAARAFRPTMTDQIAQTVGALPVYVAPGMAAARGAQLLNWSAKSAVTASAMLQSAQTSTQAVYDFSKSNLERGVSPMLTPFQYFMAAASGIVTLALERIPVGELSFLMAPGTRRAALKAVGGGAIQEGVEETLQSGFEAAGKGDPYFVEDAAFTGGLGAVLGGAMGVPHATAISLSNIKRDVAEPLAKGAEAVASAQATADAVKAAEAQKLSQRSLTRLASQLGELAGGQKVYFTAEDWTNIWTSQSLNPVDAAAKFGAKADGGMVEIDAGQYIANLVGTDDGLKAKLIDAQRKDANAFSAADATASLDLLIEQERQAKAVVTPTGAEDDSDVVADTLRKQLITAGVKERDASDYANLQASVYRTAAENYNQETGEKLTAKQLYELKPVSIGGGTGKVESKDRGTYDPTTGVISLTAKRDRSTMLHESAHHFLELTGFMNEQAGGKGHFAKQMADFRDWVDRNAVDVAKQHNDVYGTSISADDVKSTSFDEAGKTANFEAWRAQHEYFARGFEKWLTEGKAPDAEMRGMFRRFASWLRKIYTDLRLLGVNLDDRSRELFRRLVATQDVLDAADAEARRQEIAIGALVKAGIPEADAEKIAGRNRDAIDATFGKAIEKQARLLSAEDRRARRDFREQRFNELLIGTDKEPPQFVKYPVIQGAIARDLITADESIPDATNRGAFGHRILESDAKEVLSADEFDALKKRGLLTTDATGIKMEDLALEVTATNVHDLAENMVLAPDWREAVDRQIDADENAKFGPVIPEDKALEMATEAAYGADRSAAASAIAKKMQDILRRANVAATPEQRAKAKKDAADAVRDAVKEVKDAADAKELFLKGVIGMREAAAETKEKLRKLDEKIAEKKRKQAEAEARAKLLDEQKQDVAESLAFLNIDLKAVEVAQQTVAERLTRAELRPGRWKQAANSYAKQAQRALEKGDWAKFGTAKANEAVALQRADAEDRLRRDYDRAIARIERFVKTGGKDLLVGNPAYRDYANTLLSKFGFATTPAASIGEMDVKPLVPGSLAAATAYGAPSDVPVGLMLDLNDALDAVYSAFENDNKMFALERGRDIKNAVKEGQAQVDKSAPKKRPAVGTLRSAIEKFARMPMRAASYLTILDGGKPGFFTKILDRLTDADVKMNDIRKKHSAELYPLIQKLGFTKKAIGNTGVRMSGQDKVMFAAHYGSDTGRQRALAHLQKTYGVANPEAVAKEILESMSEDELNAVDKLWSVNDELFKQVVAQHESMRTPPPKAVNNAPFRVGNREMRGGYMTLRYLDQIHYSDIDAIADDKPVFNDHSQPTAGFEESRAKNVQGELDLRIDVALSHINEVARVLAFRPLARDLRRIWKGGLGDSISDKFGGDFSKETKEMLDLAIVGPPPPDSTLTKGVTMLRRNATAAGLMFNLNSAISQVLGIPATISEIGVKAFAEGARQYMADPVAAFKRAKDLHPGMAQRAGLADVNMSDVYSAAARHKFLNPILNKGFWPLQFMQAQVDVITFLGAYEKAKAEYPTKESGYWADRAFAAVKASQGGASDVDLTILHKNHFARMLTMFSTAFNNMANQYYVAAKTGDYKKFAAHVFWLAGVTTVLTAALEALRGGGPQDDEYLNWYMDQQLRHLTALHPVTRFVENTALRGNTMSIPGIRPVEAAARIPRDVLTGEWDRAGTGMVKALPLVAPVPTTATKRLIDGILEIVDGDIVTGIRTGLIGSADPNKR